MPSSRSHRILRTDLLARINTATNCFSIRKHGIYRVRHLRGVFMKNEFMTDGVWKVLTSATKRARKPVYVAVAYFGQGASKLLPLPANSRLVVDASDGAVKSGQTCPADLRKLQKRGVIIYSVPNLHAKVYVFDRFAFIGSANVSSRSAGTLIEAMFQATDRRSVSSAKKFVHSLCSNELSPGTIDRLTRIYRPPHIPGGGLPRGPRFKKNIRPILPRTFLTHLVRGDPPVGSEAVEAKGFQIAKSRRKHGRNYVLQNFNWSGSSPFRKRDKIIQIVKEVGGNRLVDAPADVIYTREWGRNGRHVTFVYLELPDVRRVGLERLAHRFGYGAKKKLLKNGLVRDPEFVEKLLGDWKRF
jgi:hypothetical protein